MNAIFRREFRAYLTSAMGLGLLAGFVVAMGLLGLYVMPRALGLGADWFSARELSMASFFAAFPWVAAVAMPALSMRIWAEERRDGTWQLLMSLPLRTRRIVLEKFCAAWCMCALMLLATAVYPVMVVSQGSVAWGPMVWGYVGSLLLGGAFVAIGMYMSGVWNSQLGAFMASLVLCGALVTWNTFAGALVAHGGGGAAALLSFFAVDRHLADMAQGYVRPETISYFLSLIVVFLALNIVWVEGRRYQ